MTAPRPSSAHPTPVTTGTVAADQPGARWWMYRRPEAPLGPNGNGEEGNGTAGKGAADNGQGAARTSPAPETDPEPDRRFSGAIVSDRVPSPLLPAALGGLALLAVVVSVQAGVAGLGRLLVPVAALLAVGAFARRAKIVHTDEPWLGRWLAYGVVAKLVASYFRYLMLVVGYDGVGDATRYDAFGAQFAQAWMGQGTAPDLPDLQQTNFIHWFTGVVYYLFGSDLITGYLVYGLLALIGTYLWYRATVDAVPFIDRRLYLALVLFVPSIVFWPSSVGKESLMQLGIGVMALGTAHLMRHRLPTGLCLGLAGGWLLWVVRPHLLAMVTLAGGLAYLAGRVKPRGKGAGSLLARPIGMVVIVFLVIFTISEGADFLGIESISVSSIEDELDEQTESTSQGGSEFDTGENSLNPIYLPRGAVTVLLRPFPWETDSAFQLLASLESVALGVFIVARLSSLGAALARSRTTPFLLYCWVLVACYSATFSSFANFGLLVRQRSLVLPALFALLAVDPIRARRHREAEAAEASEAAEAASNTASVVR